MRVIRLHDEVIILSQGKEARADADEVTLIILFGTSIINIHIVGNLCRHHASPIGQFTFEYLLASSFRFIIFCSSFAGIFDHCRATQSFVDGKMSLEVMREPSIDKVDWK